MGMCDLVEVTMEMTQIYTWQMFSDIHNLTYKDTVKYVDLYYVNYQQGKG